MHRHDSTVYDMPDLLRNTTMIWDLRERNEHYYQYTAKGQVENGLYMHQRHISLLSTNTWRRPLDNINIRITTYLSLTASSSYLA